MVEGRTASDYSLSKRGTESIAHEHVDRVTDDAVLRVMEELEVEAHDIFKEAKMAARHAGRKTVKEDDIRLVLKFRRGDDGR